MKFLLDMNISPAWVNGLTQAGHEAVHWSKIAAADAEDGLIANYARQHGFIVITNDLDFGRILSGNAQRLPSVIQLRLGDLRPRTLLEAVLRSIVLTAVDLEQGALVTVGRNRVRVAPLPLAMEKDQDP